MRNDTKIDLAIIDPYFPEDKNTDFRAKMILGLIEADPNFKVYNYIFRYRNKVLKRFLKTWFYRFKEGSTKISFLNNVRQRRKSFTEHKKFFTNINSRYEQQILFLNPRKKYEIKIALVIFLNVAYDLLYFLEKNKINFIFFLYPGGGFGINNQESDEKLKRITKSKYFKKVIVSNDLVKDYLIEKNSATQKKLLNKNTKVRLSIRLN